MKSARKTIAWLVLLLLTGGAGGGYYFYKVWEEGDELLRQRMLVKLNEIAPDWDVSIGTTRLDHQGRIRIADFKLSLRGEPQAAKGPVRRPPRLLEVPEAIITIDKSRLTEERPSIQHVRLIHPTLHVVRHANGSWTWETLPPFHLSGSLFEWEIEEGVIHVRVDETAETPATATVVRNVRMQLVPSSQDDFVIKASGGLDLASKLSLKARWSLDKKTWEMDGNLTGVKFGPALVEFLSACSDTFRTKGSEFGNRLAEHAPSFSTASPLPSQRTEPPTDAVRQPGRDAAWGLNASLDLDFHVKQWQLGADREFSVNLHVNEGELLNPVLPFPLSGLQGTIHFDNRVLQLSKFTARSDSIRFGIDATVQNPESPGSIDMKISALDLPLGPQFRNGLPVSLQRVYDLMQPTGWVDLNMDVQFDGRHGWTRKSDLTLKNCTARHRNFPYFIEQISGRMQQQGDQIKIALSGQAGRRPVGLRGLIKNPGPEAECVLVIRADQLPIDEKFREACQPGMLKAFDALQFQGEMDASLRLVRLPGPHQKFTPYLTAQVRRATVKPKAFPYAVRELSGKVESQGESSWRFTELKGQHEGARVTGEGSYIVDANGLPRLDLLVQGTEVPLDQNLYQALPEGCQSIYRELSPSGLSTFETRLAWSPGHEPQVELAGSITRGSFSVKSFPFTLDEVQAEMHLRQGEMKITSLTGRHFETQVRFSAAGDYIPGEEWRIRLENLLVEDLDPDRRFRKLLPAGLREVFETLDPRGKLTLQGMVEFRGTCDPTDPVTAAWDLDTTYSGATLTAGVDLENMHGQVSMRGEWDGDRVKANGSINLDSVSIKGYQFTELQGPIRIIGNELVLGSEEAIRGTARTVKPGSEAAREQITAKFIGGKMVFDGLAILGKQTRYFVHMSLREAQLARYAQLYLPGRNQLRGVINGWINLSGQGASPQRITGNGQIQISPAALYELPIIVQIFNALRLASPNKTAFNHAFVDFDVGGGQYRIRRADLVGDAIQLRGRGTVGFSGTTSLDFFSMMPKHQMPIPIVGDIFGEVTKGWVGVEIRGTMSNPQPKLRAIPQLDDTMRMFLGLGIPGNGSLRNGSYAGGNNDAPRIAPRQPNNLPPRSVPRTFDAREDSDPPPR